MSKITPEALRAMHDNFPAQIDDESFRDGLQDDEVRHPTPEESLVLFDLMHQLGTHRADIGFAGAGVCHLERIESIVRYNQSLSQPMEISCAARMTPEDISPIIELSQRTGAKLWVDAFIGTDPLRIAAEGWSASEMIQWVETTTNFAVSHGVDVMLVTETTLDGIKYTPEFIEQLYLSGLSQGAKRVCICDTTGAALPYEIEYAVVWMKRLLENHNFSDVKIDLHGHNDLGCAIANSVSALKAGASRIHATILGIGERFGNTDRTALQLQLRRSGLDQGAYNLLILPEYARRASEIFGIPLPHNYPGIGDKSRAVVSGVHAAAILKAKSKLSSHDADGLYLPVNYQELMGIYPSHVVRIGPMAGKANVYLWAALNGIQPPTEDQVLNVLDHAKKSNRSLQDDEIRKLLT